MDVCIANLNLLILASNSSTDTIIECDSYTWINGITYTESNYSAFHVQYDPDSICADTFFLHLTINYSEELTQNITTCDSYEWNGEVYTESGIYTSTTNSSGCNSIATLNLTINTNSTSTLDISSCNSFEWNGELYTESGNFYKSMLLIAQAVILF